MTDRIITVQTARRLAIHKQHLTGGNRADMLNTIRDMGCVQLDPISAVARSHQIVLWSRLGDYDPAELEKLRFESFHLIEYWAHAASMVLTEHYPLYVFYMRRHGKGKDDWSTRLREWVNEHESLRRHMVKRLKNEGPLPSRAFESQSERGVGSVGWTSGRDITHMMDYLWNSGKVVVAGRQGNQRLWGLAEQFLPEWTPQDKMTEEKICYEAAQVSLKALGVGTMTHIRNHFTRKRYTNLDKVMKKLEKDGRMVPVSVENEDGVSPWRGQAYIHADDLPLVDLIELGDFQPQTTLLSPFDNLICDRQRTEQLWDFAFRIEIYVPKAKREFGYYVLPILAGDQLIGRIDPHFNKKTKTLTINAVYRELDAPDDLETINCIREAIQNLASWLGAKDIRFGAVIPDAWATVTA